MTSGLIALARCAPVPSRCSAVAQAGQKRSAWSVIAEHHRRAASGRPAGRRVRARETGRDVVLQRPGSTPPRAAARDPKPLRCATAPHAHRPKRRAGPHRISRRDPTLASEASDRNRRDQATAANAAASPRAVRLRWAGIRRRRRSRRTGPARYRAAPRSSARCASTKRWRALMMSIEPSATICSAAVPVADRQVGGDALLEQRRDARRGELAASSTAASAFRIRGDHVGRVCVVPSASLSPPLAPPLRAACRSDVVAVRPQQAGQRHRHVHDRHRCDGDHDHEADQSDDPVASRKPVARCAFEAALLGQSDEAANEPPWLGLVDVCRVRMGGWERRLVRMGAVRMSRGIGRAAASGAGRSCVTTCPAPSCSCSRRAASNRVPTPRIWIARSIRLSIADGETPKIAAISFEL